VTVLTAANAATLALVEVAAEKNSTLVMPFPVELLRFVERATHRLPEAESTEDISRHRAPTD